MTFQCERCWFLNLVGQLPKPGMNDMYLKLIHRANLDAMGGCAITTTKSHAAATKHMVWNCTTIHKTPIIPPCGPCPLSDTVGMSIAVDMLFNGMTATPRLWGETHIQFKLMRRVRAMFTKAWFSSPQEISEGASFSSGFGKTIWMSCPTEQDWFSRLLRGCEIRMGYATKSNCSLTTNTINKLLSLLQQEAEAEVSHMAREYWKVGTAIVQAMCASLWGPEVLLLDLAGLKNHIKKGKEGVVPDKPLWTSTD
jgi:hypothetical protein